MFRSKLFTAAFSILSVLILGLLFIFFYLVFGNGKARLEQAYSGNAVQEDTVIAAAEQTELQTDMEIVPETSSREQEASVSASEEAVKTEETVSAEEQTSTAAASDEETAAAPADTSVRALKADEPHNYPVIGQDIPETGIITIIKSGDNGEGIVFHAAPQFDAADTPGNVVNYSGAFDITGKTYILSNGNPFLLYKTFDNYYVTSSPAYMSYVTQPDNRRTIQPDASKICDFGLSEGEEIVIRIFHEDGNHIIFTIYNYNPASGELLPVLENVIAVYQPNGVADFEYHNADGLPHKGTIAFETVQGAEYSKLVDVNFESPVSFRLGERSEVVLHN